MHSTHPALQSALKKVRALKPDQFEIYFERSQSVDMDARNQEIETLTQAEDIGLAIRLVRDRKTGFSFTTSLNPDAIDRAIEQAFEMARFMPEDEHVGFTAFARQKYPVVNDLVDQAGLRVPLSEKTALAKQLERDAKKLDSRITAVRSASIGQTHFQIHLIDSAGEEIQYEKTLFTAQLTCKAESGSDSQVGSDFSFHNRLDQLDLTTVASEAVHQATQLLGAGTAPTLQCPAVFKNSVVASLLQFLAPSFSVEQVEKGRSLLANLQQQKIFSDSVTLVDDALRSGGYGTRPFDAEGVASQHRVLVQNGVLREMLCNPYYAKKKGLVATGSSVRGLKSLPGIGYSNFYIEAGQKSFASLVSSIPKGVFITNLMGVHTANPVTGDFSLGASGVLIEDGKLTRPVRGFAIAGNVLALFKKISDISNDLRFFGKIGAPSVQLSEISMSGV